MQRSLLVLLFIGIVTTGFAADQDMVKVDESWGALKVRPTAPIPEEVTNQTQAQALCRDAAIVRGQTALLTHVLSKKAHSKKTLAEAEVPSLELQQSIRGYIHGARVVRTQWLKDSCAVTLVLDKSELKSILRKN